MSVSSNPAELEGSLADEAVDRIPMSSPNRKLEVPELPGYRLYWFRGEPGRISWALRGGYRFVNPSEVTLHNFDIGGDLSMSGTSTDDDKVAVAAQDGISENGQFLKLYLMKIKKEHYVSDQQLYEKERIDPFVSALRGGVPVEAPSEMSQMPGDAGTTYTKQKSLPKMFTKKPESKVIRTM